jgi:hypothetical protein
MARDPLRLSPARAALYYGAILALSAAQVYAVVVIVNAFR